MMVASDEGLCLLPPLAFEIQTNYVAKEASNSFKFSRTLWALCTPAGHVYIRATHPSDIIIVQG